MAAVLRKKKGPCINMEKKSAMALIAKKANAYLKDRKQANNILDIIIELEAEDEDVIVKSIQSLEAIFNKHIQDRDMYLEDISGDKKEDISPEEKLKLWLNDLYSDVKSRLITFLDCQSEDIIAQSLTTLLKFVEEEGKNPIRKSSTCKIYFPEDNLEAIIRGLLSDKTDTKTAISKFETYLQYDDVKFYMMKAVKRILKISVLNDLNEIYLNNCFTLLKLVHFESKKEDDLEDANKHILCIRDSEIGGVKFKFELVEAKKIFRSMWLIFLKAKLPNKLYKRVLYALDDKVIPFMDSPLLLTDFLMDSYNKGGVCSILALNGIFVLMHKYNLEFPEFYKNLYALFHPRVFQTRYRARFFFLSDIFLSSTHLPEYLVAAFVKRLSRLTLTAPTPCLRLLIPFIRNLLVRHKSLVKMINSPKCTKEYEVDPYDMSEVDPAKCNAMNSSLWELKDLQNHYSPDVAIAAKCIDKPLPPMETDISKFLEWSFDDMITKEGKRFQHAKEFPFNHKRLKINSFEDFVGPHWMFDKLGQSESEFV